MEGEDNSGNSRGVDTRVQSAPVTVAEMLSSASAFLEARGITDARINCEWLCSRMLRCSRLELPQRYPLVLPEKYLEAMRRGLRRLAANEPVQYILGEWDFRGHTFHLDSRALIPRPETEQLVQLALDSEALRRSDAPGIADVGTGSGCIAVSLALEIPSASLIALDTSEEALALAAENAQLHGVTERVAFSSAGLSDLLDSPSLDIIIANLPYIPTDVVKTLPLRVRNFEPVAALDGGADGLDSIRDVASDATMALRDGGSLILEIGEEQGPVVEELLVELGFEGAAVHKDLSGRVRFVTASLPFI